MQDKISSIAMFVLIVIGTVLFVMSMSGSYDPILYGSYVYFGIGLAVTVIGAAAGTIANPKGIKEMAIGVVAMLIVLAAAYGLSTGSDYEALRKSYAGLSEGMSHFSGMLLYAAYILFGVSIVTVAYSWVHSLMR